VRRERQRHLSVAKMRRPVNFNVRGHEMLYRDGQSIHVGDIVRIELHHEGKVVGCIEDGVYLAPHTKDQWTHLSHGVLIDTSFGGLVHYADEAALESGQVDLLRRQS
jgi:hypothetical protein